MNINEYLEHTWLKADTTSEKIQEICEEAKANEFKGICIPPYFVKEAKGHLGEGSKIKLVTVIGFPMGYSATAAKVEEIKRAINDGADELDVVVNVAAIKAGNWSYVESDVESMTMITHLKGKVVKLIAEVGFLTDDELTKVCNIVNKYSVNFFKTSSGYTGVDTTPEMIAKIRKMLPSDIAIKASGGIRNLETAEAVVRAGADRIGSSSCVQIVEDAKANV